MPSFFSPSEERVIKVISRKPIYISELVGKVYAKDKTPLNARNTVAGIIRKINLKCDYHHLPWFINGEGVGRGGKKVWKEKR